MDKPLTSMHTSVLCLSILVVALCGIAYELIIGALSSYLLGNSVYQFSLTIGLFMFAMGVGSFISRYFTANLIKTFVVIEVLIAVIGGTCSMGLFMVFATVPSLYHVAMYGVIIIIGTLVGVEIPLLTRILSETRSLKDALAEVFSLDYLGALIGSLAFPLLLLPHLGLIRSSFAVGLLNIAVALINIWVFRSYWKRPQWVMLAGVAITGLLIVAIAFGSYLTSYVEQRLYFDDVVYRNQSTYQRVILTRNHKTTEHRLYIDGHIQFAERDEHRYHEALVHPCMSQNSPAKRILILGGGDGMAAREVFKWQGVEVIDLVDIDPAITTTCRDVAAIARINAHVFDDPRLKLHHLDAFNYVRDVKLKYDRIIIDLPDPHNEVLNKLYSREFYRLLKRVLNPGGVMVSQSSSPFATRKVYWTIEKSMSSAGLSTRSYHIAVPSFGIWGFHMAFAADGVEDLSQPYPEKLRYFTKQVYRCSTVFGNDISKVDVPVNTMAEPILYTLYNKEVAE